MSENKKNDLLVEEIKDLFHFLTEKEPTPDDEIEGQKSFINKFKLLKNMNAFPEQQDRIDNIISKLEEWDTLDQWFIETSIPEVINTLLKIKDTKIERVSIPEEIEAKSTNQPSDETVSDPSKGDSTNIVITEIVSQVSAQFKGEIDNLKETINNLKGELGKKEESIKKMEKKKKENKISPKKSSKLPPLTIKLPIVKKPSTQESKHRNKSEDLKKNENLKISSLTPIPKDIPKQEKADNKELMIFEEEQIKTPDKKLTPIPQKNSDFDAQELDIIPELTTQPERPTIQESPKINKPEPLNTIENGDSSEDGLVIFDDETPKQKNTPPHIKKRSLITTMAMEEPLAKDKPKKDIEKQPEKTSHITHVEIEETDIERKKTTGTDLFGVFSPYRDQKSKKKKNKKKKSSEDIHVLIPSEKQETKQEHQFQNQTYSDKSVSTSVKQANIEDLPKDKDSLYQELIALEGKRYSLEKDFKEYEIRYENGNINENKFKDQTLQLKMKLDEITSRITSIRRIISSL
ncbi:MAG: hypothetical protein KGD63_11620 [Candidatus Lokiarchaeota archaeon]|nr:hypothetical protein [Candidatus Lokiarchaeota archaeon]